MTSKKIKLLAATAGLAALVATPVFATTIHKGRVAHSDAASNIDAYASQAQQPYSGNTVYGWDGRVLGSDPDPNIRFQLLRDQNLGGD